MKAFLKRWYTLMYGKDVDIRERVFCKITSVGGVIAVLALLETLIVVSDLLMSVSMFIMVLSVLVSIFLTVQLHKVEAASTLMGAIMCLFVFPGIFFTNGGIYGGATVWFTLNIVFSFLMFKGKKLYSFLVLDIGTEVVCYVLGYLHPEWIRALPSTEDVYLDSVFAVIAVGFAVSLMLQFHIRTYSEQREIVEKQKEELKQSNESQTHFFASMSHELRTPINTIIGLNDMVIRESQETDTLEYSQKIRNASKMLLSLINDILDMSQLQTQNMAIAENEYMTRDMFVEMIDMVRVLMQDKNLEFCVDVDESIPSKLFGDRKRIQQILINLLTNAVKYTPQGTVTLMASAERISGNEIILQMTVKDTGIGIRKENMKNLYEVFKRVDVRKNARVEGSGLGLAITKQLIDLMGGEITVDSIYTKGTEFTVKLKQKVVNSAPVGDIMASATLAARERERYEQLFEAPEARILIVDDISTNSFILQKLLSATRLQIDVASSGEECLEHTKSRFYHLILLDHMMPGMDGVQTLQELRKQENGLCRETPVIALTANTVSTAQRYYEELGFDAYLEKPVDALLMEKTILSLLPEDIIEYRRQEKEAGADTAVRVTRTQRKKKIVVTTDCVAEIPRELLEKYDIGMMYLYIQTKDGRFADTVEIDSDNLSQFMSDSENGARAVSVSVEEYEQFFADQLTRAESVVHISMAKNCGKSYSMAVAAAESFGHVHVVDSGHISCGESMVALYAAQQAMDGASLEEIISRTEKYSGQVITKFMMPNAKNFYLGGYTGKSLMRLCEILNIHPVLRIRKSALKLAGFTVGDLQKARKRFTHRCLSNPKKYDVDSIHMTHVALGAKEQRSLRTEVEKTTGITDLVLQKASFSAACNAGIGTIGISYFRTKNDRTEYEAGDYLSQNE